MSSPAEIFAPICFVLILSVARAQSEPEEPDFARGFYIYGTYSALNKPIFRGPKESEQIPVPQTINTAGYSGGYEWIGDSFGFGVGLSRWSVAVSDFRFDAFAETGASQPTWIHVSKPKLSFLFLDAILHVRLWDRGPATAFIHLGLGSRNSDYVVTAADSPFQSWVGHQNMSEFEFSYGIGLRYKPVRYFSLFTEYRLAPGDLDESTGGDTVTIIYYSDGTVGSSGPSGSFSNYTKIFSFGAQCTFEF